jgi:hypothetical protein
MRGFAKNRRQTGAPGVPRAAQPSGSGSTHMILLPIVLASNDFLRFLYYSKILRSIKFRTTDPDFAAANKNTLQKYTLFWSNHFFAIL